MGVQPTDWFRSYLSNRKQIVNINGVESDSLANSCGVPQGSILGPLLFLYYVNDMPNSTSCLMLQYADDSALIYSDNDPEKISNVLRDNLESCNKLLIENKLSLLLLLYCHSPNRTVGILLCAFSLATTIPPSVHFLMLSIQPVFLRPGLVFPSTSPSTVIWTRLSDQLFQCPYIDSFL